MRTKMKKSLIQIIYILLLPILLNPLNIFAFSDDSVHKEINKYSAYQSTLDEDNYLAEELLFKNGLTSVILNKRIFEWIREGGEAEDARTRALNHFHDPLENDWDQAGGIWGRSAILWAQDESNNSSWRVARENYWNALQFDDKGFSEYSYAKAFQSLGQVMHLVSDMAVPAHVRDDLHPEIIVMGDTRFINFKSV